MTIKAWVMAAAFAAGGWIFPVTAQEAPTPDSATQWQHGLSLMGTPKYPEGFPHFDYVNPDAPKGGRVRLSAVGSFDTFNFVIPRGLPAAGIGLIYETLMTASYDEVSTEYGLLAEAVRYPDDFSSVTYRLRDNARWHDGVPVTVKDVIFSLDALKKNSPFFGYYYRNVTGAEKTGEREVTFIFDEIGNRELPQIVGQMYILPKHYWEGTDAQGRTRDITAGTLEPPLGSGPYRVGRVVAGRTVAYERVEDHWGRDLNVYVGKHNFDAVVYEYYRDMTVMLEAFKADQYDFRIESSARDWATGYDFPARARGDVVVDTYPERASGGMQAFTLNLRREKFADPRVRRAFNLAMDFDDMNRTLFYGQYARINSYFEGTELAATGVPEGLELEILESVRSEVPEEVFTTAYENPTGGGAQAMRTNLREATRLLAEAGWRIDNGKLVDEAGEPFTVEFLLAQPNFERVVLFYRPALERLGITVTVRTVDSTQFVNRQRERDFDIIVGSWTQSLSPGNEQRDFWGSEAAGRPGSRNLAGIKNPAVDKLIDRIIFAKTREELVAATRALDRVLLWNHYMVPQWTSPDTRFAYWNRLAHPDPLPEYNIGFPDIWWYRPEGPAPQPQEIEGAPGEGEAP